MIRAASLALCLFAAPAAAQEDPEALARAALTDLAEAARAADAAEGRRDRVTGLTRTLAAYESGLAALRASLRQVIRREQALSAALDARSTEIAGLLGILASLETSPAPVLLLHPEGPLASLRAGMVVAELTPALAAEADALRADLQEIERLRSLQDEAEAALTRALLGAQTARATLSRAIAERTDLPTRFTADPDRMAELLAAADSLAAFTSALGTFGAPPGALNPPLPAGALPLPATGTVLRGFREPDAAGIARPGLLVATAPHALVTAPLSATVRYTGPLLDYGNVMILEPRADTLVVLAGLGEVYGAEGTVVAPGDPLGLMGAPPVGPNDEFADPSSAQTGSGRSETLYIEVREGEIPVDPARLFAIDRQE